MENNTPTPRPAVYVVQVLRVDSEDYTFHGVHETRESAETRCSQLKKLDSVRDSFFTESVLYS